MSSTNLISSTDLLSGSAISFDSLAWTSPVILSGFDVIGTVVVSNMQNA